jgi:hypothetical protein
MGHGEIQAALPSPESIPGLGELARVLNRPREIGVENRKAPVLEGELVEKGFVIEGRRILLAHRGSPE